VDLSVGEAVVLAATEDRPVRVIAPDTAIHLDLRLDRLNIWINAYGSIHHIDAG
jgi:hypothetical protein